MVNDELDIEFTIDNYTPETIPMAFLAVYMGELAKIIGFEDRVHFARLNRHSLGISVVPDEEVRPEVVTRLEMIQRGQIPTDARAPIKTINKLLQQHNAVGSLTAGTRDNVIRFPGRDLPRPILVGPTAEHGELEGQVVAVYGKDATKHIELQDEQRTLRCDTSDIRLARDLAQHLFGSPIRVFGMGFWERRDDEQWHLRRFRIERYEVLGDTPLPDLMQQLGSLDTEWKQLEDPLSALHRLRYGDEEGGHEDDE